MTDINSPLWNVVHQMMEDHQSGSLKEVEFYCRKAPQCSNQIAAEYGRLLHSGLGATSSTDNDSDARPASSRIGQSIDHYRLIRLLGRGAQGSVYLAEDTRHSRQVALKLLPQWASTPSSRWQRLQREAAALAKLSHPVISRLLDSGEVDGSPYLVTEFIDGATFAELQLTPSSNQQLRHTLSIFQQCALALHSAHLAGIVHRDIKPGNLILGPHEQPVILDFGLAFDDSAVAGSNQDRLTRTGTTLGTPAYLAPELLHQDEPTARSDQFSLAATLYHCLTGRVPHQGKRIVEILHAIQHDAPPPACKLNPTLPLEIEIVLEKAMSKDPAHRYPDLRAFANDLEAVCLRNPIVARRLPMPMRVRRWMQRHPVGTTVLGFVALFLLAGFWHTRQLLNEKNVRLLQAEREKYLMASRLLVETNPMGAAQLAKFALDADADASARTAILSALVRLYATYTGAGVSGKVGPVPYVQPVSDVIVYLNPEAELVLDEHPQAVEHELRELNLPPGDWAGRGDYELGGRLVLSDDSKTVAIAPQVGEVHVLNLDTDKWRRLPMSDQAQISCIDFHADGNLLACGDFDGVLRVFDLRTDTLLLERTVHSGFFGYVEFWEEQQCLVTGSPGGHRLGVPTDRTVQLLSWSDPTKEPTRIPLAGFLSEAVIDRQNQRLYLGDSLGWLTAFSAEQQPTAGLWPSSWKIQLPNRIHSPTNSRFYRNGSEWNLRGCRRR